MNRFTLIKFYMAYWDCSIEEAEQRLEQRQADVTLSFDQPKEQFVKSLEALECE